MPRLSSAVLLLACLVCFALAKNKYAECLVSTAEMEPPRDDFGATAPLRQLVVRNEHKLSCMDARTTTGVLGTHGGDAGEFLSGVAALSQLLAENDLDPLEDDDIEEFFERTVDFMTAEQLEPPRQFYLHSDEVATTNLFLALGLSLEDAQNANTSVYDISNLDPDLHEKALELLIQPSYQGCDHLQLVMRNPELYGVPTELTNALITAFYKQLWREEELLLFSNDLEISDIQSVERCILEVHIRLSDSRNVTESDSSTSCHGQAPLVSTEMTDDISCLVYDPAAPHYFRGMLASVFLSSLDFPRAIPAQVLLARMNIVADHHRNLTLNFLLPNVTVTQYIVELKLKAHDDYYTLFYVMMAVLLVVLIIGCLVNCIVSYRNHKRGLVVGFGHTLLVGNEEDLEDLSPEKVRAPYSGRDRELAAMQAEEEQIETL